MLSKGRDRSVAQTAFVDLFLDIIGYFIRSLAIGVDFKLLVVDTHKFADVKITRTKNSGALIFALAGELMNR